MPARVNSPAVLVIAIAFLSAALWCVTARPLAAPGPAQQLADATSLAERGQAAFQAGRLDEAQKLLQEAIHLAPNSARAQALLGLTLARQRDEKDALIHLGKAHQIDPANSDYAYDFSLLLIQARRFDTAVPVLEELHRRSPESADVLVNLARAYAGAGESRKLSALVSTLPEAEYRNQPLLKALAGEMAAGRQTAPVEALWQAAIHHDPSRPLPYAALAALWTARGDANRALVLLDSAPAAARGPVYLYALGKTQFALRKYQEASTSFRQITRLAPENQEGWRQLITSYLLGNQPAQAEAAAKQAASHFPGIAEFPYQQAVADYMLGRDADARAALAPIITEDGSSDSRPLLLMAVLLSQSGKYSEATDYFARAERLETGCNPLASYFYGATLLRMHRPQDAVLQLQTAVRCRAHFALAEYRLGQALAQSGKDQEALAALEQSTRDDPTLAEPYYALAQLRRRVGDMAGAQRALAKFSRLQHHAADSDRNLFRSSWR
jgi:predicted Zn-dependent protease